MEIEPSIIILSLLEAILLACFFIMMLYLRWLMMCLTLSQPLFLCMHADHGSFES